MARILSCGSPLRVPAPARELAEDDEVAPVVGHDLPVAAAQRAVPPPPVPPAPGPAHRPHGPAADRLGPPAGAGADFDGPRRREAARAAARPSPVAPHGSHGASVCRRSGTRESGSTGTMRSAASGPPTARARPPPPRSPPARIAAGRGAPPRPARGPPPRAAAGRGSGGAGRPGGAGGGGAARGPPRAGAGRRGGGAARPAGGRAGAASAAGRRAPRGRSSAAAT